MPIECQLSCVFFSPLWFFDFNVIRFKCFPWTCSIYMANYASQVNSARKARCSAYHSFIFKVASCSQRFHSVFTTESCKMHKGRKNTISEHVKWSYPEVICLYMKLLNQQIHKMNASIYKNPGSFVHSFYSSILCLLSNESTLSIVLNDDNKLKTK